MAKKEAQQAGVVREQEVLRVKNAAQEAANAAQEAAKVTGAAEAANEAVEAVKAVEAAQEAADAARMAAKDAWPAAEYMKAFARRINEKITAIELTTPCKKDQAPCVTQGYKEGDPLQCIPGTITNCPDDSVEDIFGAPQDGSCAAIKDKAEFNKKWDSHCKLARLQQTLASLLKRLEVAKAKAVAARGAPDPDPYDLFVIEAQKGGARARMHLRILVPTAHAERAAALLRELEVAEDGTEQMKLTGPKTVADGSTFDCHADPGLYRAIAAVAQTLDGTLRVLAAGDQEESLQTILKQWHALDDGEKELWTQRAKSKALALLDDNVTTLELQVTAQEKAISEAAAAESLRVQGERKAALLTKLERVRAEKQRVEEKLRELEPWPQRLFPNLF